MPKEYREALHKEQHDRLVRDSYRITLALDSTRPINDASGHIHVITDLYTPHCYTRNINEFRDEMKAVKDEGYVHREFSDRSQEYRGRPCFLDE